MGASVTAYVGLGSNLDDPAQQLEHALDGLRQLPATRLLQVSSFYGNPPLGPPDQPDYVNAVAALETTLAPVALLSALQAIERAQGRVRSGTRWGPRTIDLDLLTYGDHVIREPGLEVPHPGVGVRAFVLLPLAEIAPDLKIPGYADVGTLIAATDVTQVLRLTRANCNSWKLRNR